MLSMQQGRILCGLLGALQTHNRSRNMDGTVIEPTREEFLARRKKGIGGSDVAALLGIDEYGKTPEDLWLEKTGQSEPIDTDNYHKRRGRMFEPVIRQLYAEKYPGRSVVRVPYLMQHPEYPWMIANIDGHVTDAGTQAYDTYVLEIKCPSIGGYKKMTREDMKGGLRKSWILQMQHYLAVTGAKKGVYAIFCAELCEFIDFEVDRDEEMIAFLIEKEREFWVLVETMQPPPPIVQAIKGEEVVVVGDVTKRRDEEFTEAARMLREASELKKQGEEIYDAAKEKMVFLMGKVGIYEGGGGRFYYVTRGGKKSFQKAALASAHPLDRKKVAEELARVATRAGIDIDISGVLLASELDLAEFEKTGASFNEFRPYFFGA